MLIKMHFTEIFFSKSKVRRFRNNYNDNNVRQCLRLALLYMYKKYFGSVMKTRLHCHRQLYYIKKTDSILVTSLNSLFT